MQPSSALRKALSSRESLRRAVLLHEILGPPKALQPPSSEIAPPADGRPPPQNGRRDHQSGQIARPIDALAPEPASLPVAEPPHASPEPAGSPRASTPGLPSIPKIIRRAREASRRAITRLFHISEP